MRTKHILPAALAVLLITAMPARAIAPPSLTVIDTINPGGGSSYTMDSSVSTALVGYLYFTADDGTHGAELWRTNGSTTELVEDINTANSGADSSDPESFTALGSYLYFTADDGTHGAELWRTNGSTTERVPFPVAGQVTSSYGNDTSIATVGGRLYTAVWSAAIGYEFAYLDEPTASPDTPGEDLSSTNRDAAPWLMTLLLLLLAGVTVAAGIRLLQPELRRE